MKQEVGHFSDSPYKLDAFTFTLFTFKAGVAQPKDEQEKKTMLVICSFTLYFT